MTVDRSLENFKRLQAQIQDIVEAIEATETFVAGMDFATFRCDPKTVYAVERSLGIIGATAKRLPWEFIDRHPQLNWREIIGLGDRLMYGVFETDLAVLWQALQSELPPLKKLMEESLRAAGEGQ
ncbi:MAG: HepT-like ribonuclease domain-containing protein [Pseudanabaenaceae cyanobacterium]